MADHSEAWRERLDQALKDRNLSRTDVSAEAGFHPSYVSRILTGAVNPTVHRLQQICSVAGIDFTYLFLGEDAEEKMKGVLDKSLKLN